jgi:methyltransferase (TIGR00027 family)
MQTGQPSRTALSAAIHRAAHQLLERGEIFADPLAVRILAQTPEAIIKVADAYPEQRRMRLFIAARTRFAEDALAAAVARGVRQLVVLGAGLDTFAYRNPYEAEGLAVFEADHPSTQAWKRARLAEVAIAPPPSLAYAPVDFETETLADGLSAAGFDPTQPSFFTWAGVVPYLTRAAALATLAYVGGLPGGGEIVFDYSDPPATLEGPEQQAAQAVRAERVAQMGEPWLTYFSAEELAAELGALGFGQIEDLDPVAVAERYFGVPPGQGRRRGGHLIRAARQSRHPGA